MTALEENTLKLAQEAGLGALPTGDVLRFATLVRLATLKEGAEACRRMQGKVVGTFDIDHLNREFYYAEPKHCAKALEELAAWNP